MSEASVLSSRICNVTLGGVDTQIPTDHHINQIWLSSYIYAAIAASNELGFFKTLSSGPVMIERISVECGVGIRAAEILTNVLISSDLIRETNDGFFEFTVQGATFLDPNSIYSWGGMFARELKNPLVQQIIQSSKKDNTSIRPDFLLTNNWVDSSVNIQDASSITLGMHSESAVTAVIQAQALSLEKSKHVLDVGGGSGVFSIALAEVFPHLTSTVAELPSVIEVTKNYLNKSSAHDRLKTLPFNMFQDPWPTNYDVMFLSNILHDWDPSTIRFLLKNAFQSLPSGGSIIINEMLLTKDKNIEAAAFSVVMLVRTLGKQLTFNELKSYLVEAGFVDIALLPSDSIFDLIKAKKL